MKKLKLNRETVSILSSSDLSAIHGGAPSNTIIIIQKTRICPIPTGVCTGGSCVETITSGGTSVINPSGGFGG
jgi:hypothetical protein